MLEGGNEPKNQNSKKKQLTKNIAIAFKNGNNNFQARLRKP